MGCKRALGLSLVLLFFCLSTWDTVADWLSWDTLRRQENVSDIETPGNTSVAAVAWWPWDALTGRENASETPDGMEPASQQLVDVLLCFTIFGNVLYALEIINICSPVFREKLNIYRFDGVCDDCCESCCCECGCSNFKDGACYGVCKTSTKNLMEPLVLQLLILIFEEVPQAIVNTQLSVQRDNYTTCLQILAAASGMVSPGARWIWAMVSRRMCEKDQQYWRKFVFYIMLIPFVVITAANGYEWVNRKHTDKLKQLC